MTEIYRKTVVSRASSAGLPLEVVVEVAAGSVVVRGAVDGVRCRTSGVNRAIPGSLRAAGFVAAVGAVPLTPGELAATEAAVAEAKAAWESSPWGLRARRDDLARDLARLASSETAARSRAWERGDESRPFRTPDAANGRADAARAALAAFDAEHPEVLAAVKAADKSLAATQAWN